MSGLQISEAGYMGLSTFLIVLAFIIAGAFFAVLYTLVRYIKRDAIKVDERKRGLRKSTKAYDPAAERNVPEKENKSVILKQIKKLTFTEKLGERLIDADIPVKPEEFIEIWLGAVIIVPSLLFLVTTNILLSIVAIAACGFVPEIYIKSQKKKKLQRFDDQLADALLMISNCLVAGLSFQQAMENIAREMPNPISGEFGRVVKEMRYGKTLDKSLKDMMERIDSDDLMIAMNAVLIQHQVGGNLSEILETIAQTVKDRRQIKKDIKVLTSQGRVSGWIIAVLPAALCLIISIANPGYMTPMFTTFLGIAMLVVGIIMELIGIMFIQKIVNIEY